MKEKLPDTLSRRVQYLRESLNFSKERLAELSNIELATINDIEEGIDNFLSAGLRQKLSRALRVHAIVLKEVEKLPKKSEIPEEIILNIKGNILSGNLDNNFCPVCKKLLKCKIVVMRDLEDNQIRHPKARCEKCPFQIK
jgi:transcriptional regulator with XRE-family HTH domain